MKWLIKFIYRLAKQKGHDNQVIDYNGLRGRKKARKGGNYKKSKRN